MQDELQKGRYRFDKLKLLDVADVVIVEIEVTEIRRLRAILNPSGIIQLCDSVVAEDDLLQRM